jgi:hypothetical protein
MPKISGVLFLEKTPAFFPVFALFHSLRLASAMDSIRIFPLTKNEFLSIPYLLKIMTLNMEIIVK